MSVGQFVEDSVETSENPETFEMIEEKLLEDYKPVGCPNPVDVFSAIGEEGEKIYIRDRLEIFEEVDKRYEIGVYRKRFLPGETYEADSLEDAYRLLVEDILDRSVEGLLT